ncbi:MAG: thioredoxin family protein [Bacteroidia bacterium]|nr:thioredoxin family protein [Bacteroidia bacterium]
MKKLITFIMTLLLVAGIQTASAQEAKVAKKIYNPAANAREDINQAVKKAKAEGKHVLIQVGGNWCGWCILFHGFINEDPEIKKFIEDNYVFTLLNTSAENKNTELLKEYNNPGRLGYPVFLILNAKGKLIHTQDSGLLEEGKGYNKGKVMGFLRNWTPAAVDPKNFK